MDGEVYVTVEEFIINQTPNDNANKDHSETAT